MTDTAYAWLSSRTNWRCLFLNQTRNPLFSMRPTAYHMQGLVKHSNYIKPDHIA